DGGSDMEPEPARGLDDWLVAIGTETLANVERDAGGLAEPGRRTRIEIEHEGGRLIGPLDRPAVRMQLDRAEIGEPGERRRLVDHAVLEQIASRAADRMGADPRWTAPALRLEPARAVDAFRKPPEHRRPASQMRQEDRGDGEQVVDQLTLRRA